MAIEPTTAQLKQEEELLSRLRSGDVAAMSELYDRYSKALFGIVLRIMRNQEIAEDVLQEAFLKIWSSIGSYDADKGRLFTWMLNLTRNLAIDKLRSKQYKQQFRTESIDSTSINFYSDNSSDTKPDQIGIKELTEKLKPEQKTIIDLLYFEGYTQTEAAEELQIPLGTVKTRARAALKVLSSILKYS